MRVGLAGQVTFALMASAPVAAQHTVCEDIKLGPFGPVTWFGFTMDVCGDTLVSAAIGGIYVYEWDGSAWGFETKLINPGNPSGDFAVSLDLDGAILVAGDPERGFVIPKPGRAEVYQRQAGFWRHMATLRSQTARGDDWYGNSVAVSGDTLAVGAPLEDDACTNNPDCESGAAYVYRRVGLDWVLEARLLASDVGIGEEFGWDVALEGDLLAVGATDALGGPGAIYVFGRDGTVWTEVAQLSSATPTTSSALGAALHIEGQTIVAGDGGNSTFGSSVGTAYVFSQRGGTWGEEALLLPSDPGTHLFFGGAVRKCGDRIVVGAATTASVEGAAYVFERDGGAWSEVAKLRPTDPLLNNWFGREVALSDEWVICNSQDLGPGFTKPGALYFYSVDELPETYCTGGISSGGCSASLHGEGRASVSAGAAEPFELVATELDGGGRGIFVWGAAAASLPFGSAAGSLCVGGRVLSSPSSNAGGTPGQCDGELRFDLNQWMSQNPAKAPGPGDTVYAQAAYMGAVQEPRVTSDALSFTVCP
jgi:hypothetical protein